MRTLTCWLPLALVVTLCACDASRPRFDPDSDADVDATMEGVDGGLLDSGVDAAMPDGRDAEPRPDGGVIVDMRVLADEGVGDATLPDSGDSADRGATIDPDAGLSLDAALADEGVARPDADVEGDEGVDPDRGVDPDAAQPGGFITGVAQAADGRTPVDVAVGAVQARTNAAGAFRIGPLPAGPITLTISAERHQSLSRDVDVPEQGEQALDEAILLYRGRRIGPAAGSQLRISSDDAWIIWSQDDALWRRGTAVGDQPLELLPRAFEVFLGFVPGLPQIAIRRRVEAGLAGNIEVVDLIEGDRQQIFEEAQPWLRWRGESALGMIGTRDGLSTLALGTPGEIARPLGVGVPWLLVTELADGSPAWAQRRDDDAGFDIWRGGVAQAAERISGALTASNAFLSTTPGRTGLLWISPEGALTRWEPETGPRVIAVDAIASPRPRFLAGERVLFWRADVDEPGLEHLFMLDADGERSVIAGVDANSLRIVGERYYIVRPDDGLWTGDLAGAPSRLIAGGRVEFATQGAGVIALVDGIAHTAIPGGPAMNLGVEGLSTLQALNLGATAWQADGGRLWWVPGPDQAAPATPLVEGAPRARLTVERGNAAVYVLGAEGYFRAPIPPGPATLFAEPLSEITSISEGLALGYTSGAWLYGVEPATGTVTGWAPIVDRIVVSGSRRLVTYVSDRGTFLVDLAD